VIGITTIKLSDLKPKKRILKDQELIAGSMNKKI
jgi:hypothetical protein